jgi:hypothetical protein
MFLEIQGLAAGTLTLFACVYVYMREQISMALCYPITTLYEILLLHLVGVGVVVFVLTLLMVWESGGQDEVIIPPVFGVGDILFGTLCHDHLVAILLIFGRKNTAWRA